MTAKERVFLRSTFHHFDNKFIRMGGMSTFSTEDAVKNTKNFDRFLKSIFGVLVMGQEDENIEDLFKELDIPIQEKTNE